MNELQRLRRNEYMKEWSRRNKEKIAIYREKKKEEIRINNLLYMKGYNVVKKDEIAVKSKAWREKNKNDLHRKKRDEYFRHKERYQQSGKLWREKNKQQLKDQSWQRHLNKMKPKSGFFYFIRFDNFFKVGVAINWDKRKKSYELHNPFSMQIISCIWVTNANIIEHAAKRKFKDYWFKGREWFKDIPEAVIALVGNWENVGIHNDN